MCVCVSIYMCIFVCKYVCTHLCMCAGSRMYVSTYYVVRPIYTYIHTGVCVCVYIYIYTSMYVCV